MSDVTIRVGGRAYTISCQDGQEPHIARLGGMINTKLATMPPKAGQNEPRMLLFAALLLADEVHELKKREAQNSAPKLDFDSPAMAPTLEALAERLENLAEVVERG